MPDCLCLYAIEQVAGTATVHDPRCPLYRCALCHHKHLLEHCPECSCWVSLPTPGITADICDEQP
jgi:lipopolysaccharide biosynthesis regulator YciM